MSLPPPSGPAFSGPTPRQPVLPVQPVTPTLPAGPSLPPRVAPAPIASPAIVPDQFVPTTPTHRLTSARTTSNVRTGPLGPLGLRGALMISAYTAVCVTVVMLALHLTDGLHTLDAWRRGTVPITSDSLAWAHRFDHRTVWLFAVSVALLAVGAVTTSMWSDRVLRNTQELGHRNVYDWLVVFAWFIPFLCYYAGFKRLRRAPGSDWQLVAWQFFFATPAVASWLVARVNGFAAAVNNTTDAAPTLQSTYQDIHTQWMMSLVFAGCYVLATLAAAGAVMHTRATFRRIEAESATGN